MKKRSIKDFNSFAIIQTAFIGDVLLALPLAQAIKNFLPHSTVRFVTTAVSSEAAKCAQCVDEVIVYDKRNTHRGLNGIRHLSSILSSANTDCVITPHRFVRSTLLSYLSHPVFSVGFNVSALSLLYDYRVKFKLHLHESQKNMSLLTAFREFDAIPSPPKVNIKIPKQDENIINSITNSFNPQNKKIIVLAPGSVWATKRWLPEYFSELAKSLDKEYFQVFLVGSQADAELCEKISFGNNAVNLAGKTSLPQLFGLLRVTNLLVTNDSSPTHFAALVNCPTIVVYGATSPMFGFSPLSDVAKVIENDSLKCHPCRIHGSERCPIKTFECMRSIKPDMVLQECMKIVRNGRGEM